MDNIIRVLFAVSIVTCCDAGDGFLTRLRKK